MINEIPEKLLPEVLSLTRLAKEDRQAKVMQLWTRGISQIAIARDLSVSVKTIYRDLREIIKAYRDGIVKTEAAETLARTLMALDTEIQQVQEKVDSCQGISKTIQHEDPKTGVVTPITIRLDDPSEVKYMQLKAKYMEMKQNLLLRTQTIPDDPGKLFKTLEASVGREEKKRKREQRTPEEVRASIEQLLKQGRMLK